MQIQIKKLLTGAKQAKGLVVMIDTFRASNTILSCFGSGAKSILPVLEVDEALKLKSKYPEHLVFGEELGIKPQGFDYNSSPVQAKKLNLTGKDLILRTSAGSQGIVNAKQADEILIGSFANASAIIHYIKNKNSELVSLVAIGTSGREPAIEDDVVAEYLKEKLEGGNIDFLPLIDQMMEGDGAKRLKRLGQEDDLQLCLKLDLYDFVPRVNLKSGRIEV